MADLIIRKKDLENLGRKLMKEVYKFLHDKYILTFEEMKVEKDKLEKYLIKFYFKNYDYIFVNNGYLKEIEDESKYEEYLKEIENKIKNESLDIDYIFKVLDLINLEMEIDEDLFCKKKASSYIYCVFNFYYSYLVKDKIVEDEIVEDDTGAYLMIRNIGYLFSEMGDFRCNKDKKLFELWDKKESVIKKRIEVINNCLDVYDIIFPYTKRKPILSKNDLESVYKLMDRLLYDTCYPIMDENGVDLNMELGCPGWIDLKKVLMRFFSKINFDRKFEEFEEEVEGTGHIRPIRRKDGSSLKCTGIFSLRN